jgi:hypothetical protein
MRLRHAARAWSDSRLARIKRLSDVRISLGVATAGVSSQSVSFHQEDVDRGGVSGAEVIVVKDRLESRVVGEAGGESGLSVRRC